MATRKQTNLDVAAKQHELDAETIRAYADTVSAVVKALLRNSERLKKVIAKANAYNARHGETHGRS